MNLSTNPIYFPQAKIPDITTSIKDIIAEAKENQAKPIQPSNDFVLNHKKTIDMITIIPDITMRIRCNLPRIVVNFPPSSKGKKIVTTNTMSALIANKYDPTRPSSPLIPQSKPIEKITNKVLPVINKD